MYDFNFIEKKKNRLPLYISIFIILSLMMIYYCYKGLYSDLKSKQSYIKENREKIDYLFEQEGEIESLSKDLETISKKEEYQNLNRLKTLVYLSPDIDKVIIARDYLKIEGTSKTKELVFTLRDQIKEAGYLNLEIIEVKFLKDDNFYKYIMESDGDEKEE